MKIVRNGEVLFDGHPEMVPRDDGSIAVVADDSGYAIYFSPEDVRDRVSVVVAIIEKGVQD